MLHLRRIKLLSLPLHMPLPAQHHFKQFSTMSYILNSVQYAMTECKSVCSEQVSSYELIQWGSVELALYSNSVIYISPTTIYFLGLLGVGGPCGRGPEDDYN